MSERLSRMDRHPSTRKKRRKRPTFKQEWHENQIRLTDTTVMRLSVPENRTAPEPEPPLPPRAAAAYSAVSAPALEAPRAKQPEEEEQEDLPPRSTVYPSSRIRGAKWFYETLVLLFLILLGTLLWWGTQATGVKWPWQ
ncbi:hypothetical protein QWJ34_07410 [Saccharibacillus sp. CPCC 101409]|uniref:hypothetical protein n=1 Tax=Saccharibacillus sp. CPCC 101409 TaxID=3058041 RepID=UPI002672D594|nr:hypothetical protein [Saccharibacillus sp. CPCC 101409]MDO3409587.1 hypothetical protein [Saccharibacillus sp. CPCC 101409]